MSVELEPYGSYEIKELATEETLPIPPEVSRKALLVLATRSVDPASMETVEGFAWSDPEMTKRTTDVDCPEAGELSEGVFSVVGAISFAIGIALDVGPIYGLGLPNHFIPETPEDKQRLSELGTGTCRVPLASPGGIEIFGDAVVDADLVRKLARRHAVCVYPNVLGANDPATKFRELWLVLELSFQAHGKDLVDRLVAFPPAQRLGFEREELEALRGLRGQVSHAASRHGHRDVGRANNEATASLDRLWSLVDWVLLSKKESSSSPEVEELLPLAAYITSEGTIDISRDVENPTEWAWWALNSVRFISSDSLG